MTGALVAVGTTHWMRDGQERCPLKSNQTVHSQAAENYKAWREAQKKHNAKKKHAVSFELMDKNSKKKMKK
jgi:hypothetical protein